MTTQPSQGQDQARSTNSTQPSNSPSGMGGALLTMGGLALCGLGVALALVPEPLAEVAAKLTKQGLQPGNLALGGLFFGGMGLLARQIRKGHAAQRSASDALGDMGVAVHSIEGHFESVHGVLAPIQGEVQVLRGEVHQFATQLDQKDQQSEIYHVAGSVDKLSAFLDKTLKAFGAQMDERMAAISAQLERSSGEIRERVDSLQEDREPSDPERDQAPVLERIGQLEGQLEQTHATLQALLEQFEAQSETLSEALTAAQEARAIVCMEEEADEDNSFMEPSATAMQAKSQSVGLEATSRGPEAQPASQPASQPAMRPNPEAPPIAHRPEPTRWEMPETILDEPQSTLQESQPLQYLEPETGSEPSLEDAPSLPNTQDRDRYAHALDHLFRGDMDQPAQPSAQPSFHLDFEPAPEPMEETDESMGSFEFEDFPEDEPAAALPSEPAQETPPSPSFAKAEPRSIPGVPPSAYPTPIPLNRDQPGEGNPPAPSPYAAPKEPPMRFRFPGLGDKQ